MHRLLALIMIVITMAGCAPPAVPGATGAAPASAPAAAAAEAPARPAPERVRMVYSSIAGVTAVPLLAQERGLFAANGLEVELLYVASGATATQSLLAGEIQFVLGGTEAIVSAAAAGADLRVFAGLVDVVPFSLLVRS